ncbi:ArsC family reductase [Acetobacter sacchari]|uniref:ArsC family reductase n=1 Tax=Acetobacter sacchari TaxID=2661687 RepID=A0ABS3LZH5_9PROT|nr:ArsC family reductase [Acetobacter sacchari]MBO1361305.1 ArsC family reductase [Acetobacter sacchari]
MTVTLYGIKSCDTMRKARAWLDEHGVTYAFHDYKAQGIEEATLRRWVSVVGWEILLNRAGTTFKKLPPDAKENIDADKAVSLMLSNPSMIKRPVLDNGAITVGFRQDAYEALFSRA